MTISGTLANAFAVTCHPSTTVFTNGSDFVQPLCSDNDLTMSGYLAASHMPVAAPRDKPENMRLLDSDGLHECGDIVREEFSGIGASWFVGFTGPSEVKRKASKVLSVLSYLEGITGVVGGQIGNEDQGFTCSLLIIIHGQIVGFDFRHGVCPSKKP